MVGVSTSHGFSGTPRTSGYSRDTLVREVLFMTSAVSGVHTVLSLNGGAG
jgi:hypothetical protein